MIKLDFFPFFLLERVNDNECHSKISVSCGKLLWRNSGQMKNEVSFLLRPLLSPASKFLPPLTTCTITDKPVTRSRFLADKKPKVLLAY